MTEERMTEAGSTSAPTASSALTPASPAGSSEARLRVFRGTPGSEPRFDEFDVPVEDGMVVLDALHWI